MRSSSPRAVSAGDSFAPCPPYFPNFLPLLAAFLPRIRQEAERLVDDDSVRGLDIVDDEALAEVRLDDVKVNTPLGARRGAVAW